MHIISPKKLKEFWRENKEAEQPLKDWIATVKRAEWQNLAEVKIDYSHADKVGGCTVFNIGGNKYRLVAYINFRFQKFYVLHILTHKEYDTDKWKIDCF